MKRALDLMIAVPALLVLSPLLVAAALAVRATSKGKALFRQERVGQRGKSFPLMKLRTMYDDADHSAYREFNLRELAGEPAGTSDGVHKLEYDPRITPVGRFLRRTSIDELPQLINVIKGQMSIVGPRPSLPFEVDTYTPRQLERQAVKPGITGLWQVSGRNRLSMVEMLELDVEYVRTRSLALDLRIIARTPSAVVDTSAGR